MSLRIFLGILIVLLSFSSKAQVELSAKSAQKEDDIKQLVISAASEEAKGNIDVAVDLYKQCLKIDKNNSLVHYEISRMYRQMANLTLSVEHAEKAVELDNTNRWYKVHLADLYTYTTLFREACLVYEGLVYSNPTPEYIHRYAELLIKTGEFSKAIEAYTTLENKSGHSPEITRQKTRLYVEIDQVNKAVGELEKRSQEYPQQGEYAEILAMLFLETGETDRAIEIYRQLVTSGRSSERIHLSLFKVLQRKGKVSEAYAELPHVFATDDVDLDDKLRILFELFEATYDDRKDIGLVYSLLDTLIEVNGNDPRSFTIYGDFLYRDHDLKKASLMFEKSLEFEEDKYQVWRQLMLIDQELKDFTSLLSRSEQALERFPNQPSAYYYNGIANHRLKKYDQAISMLATGKSLVLDDPQLNMDFIIALGHAHYKQGNTDKAFGYFDNALSTEPENFKLLNNYAYFLAVENHQIEKAEKMILKVLETFPDNPSYMDTYAWVLFRKKDYSKAKEYVARALDSMPDNAVQLEHMGDILYFLKENSEAMKYWELAKKAGSKSEHLDEKITSGKYVE